jgi:hypothetical protein
MARVFLIQNGIGYQWVVYKYVFKAFINCRSVEAVCILSI